MRLLFVLPEYRPGELGGIATHYRALLPELVAQGCRVDVVVSCAVLNHFADFQENDISVRCTPANLIESYEPRFAAYRAVPLVARSLAAAWAAWELVGGGENYDVVEATDWGMLCAPWTAAQSSPPVVAALHGSMGQIDLRETSGPSLYGLLARFVDSSILTAADALCTFSTANATEWEEIIGRRPTVLPPPATSTTLREPTGGRASYGLVVGRIQQWKGPSALCEALQRLGTDAPEIHWVGRDTSTAPDGGSMSEYLARTYPDVWGRKLLPLGPKSRDETAALQQQAAFVVIPSLWDVFNYTCIESMAFEQVVLCSEGCGVAEHIRHGENGFRFPAGDAAALAECLKSASAMRVEERREIGRRAREAAAALEPARLVNERLALYRGLAQPDPHVTPQANRQVGPQASRPASLQASTRPAARGGTWGIRSVQPSTSSGDALQFLDALPLRELLAYVLTRTARKYLGR